MLSDHCVRLEHNNRYEIQYSTGSNKKTRHSSVGKLSDQYNSTCSRTLFASANSKKFRLRKLNFDTWSISFNGLNILSTTTNSTPSSTQSLFGLSQGTVRPIPQHRPLYDHVCPSQPPCLSPLLHRAKRLYLPSHRLSQLRATPATQELTRSNPRMHIAGF